MDGRMDVMDRSREGWMDGLMTDEPMYGCIIYCLLLLFNLVCF